MSNKTIEQIEQELDAKIPSKVISERDGGGGRRLSYLEGWYVIDRLNKIFGPLGWEKEITDVRQVVNTTSRGEFPAYLVKVKLSVRVPKADSDKYSDTIVKESYGYGCDKSSQNAHELAIKEAVTDALKVAAKDLGMSLGLALYDKEQTNVSEEDEETPVRQITVEKPAQRTEGAKISPKSSDTSKPGVDPSKTRTLIRSYVNAAIKKGVLTLDNMKKHLNENYGADNLDGVKDESLEAILTYVKGLTT